MKNSLLKNSTTFIIKTFLRKECLTSLLLSIERVYPEHKVLILDDSLIPSLTTIEIANYNLLISYTHSEFNIGLSRGRNVLVKKVKTKYFVLLDDDFILDYFSHIEDGLQILIDNQFDILGGKCMDLISDENDLIERKFVGNITKKKHALYLETVDTSVKTIVCDFTLNFFIAKTSSVKKVLWSDELKILEHIEFFYRAKLQGLKVGFSPIFYTLHKPKTNKEYMAYRTGQIDKYSNLLMNKLGVKRIFLDGNLSRG